MDNSGVEFIADNEIFCSYTENVPIDKTIENIRNISAKAVMVVTRIGRRPVESQLIQNGFICYDLFDELNFVEGIDYDNLCRDIREFVFGVLYHMHRINSRIIPARYRGIMRDIERKDRIIDGYVDICVYKQMMKIRKTKEYLRKLIRAYYQIKEFELLSESIKKYIELYEDEYTEIFKDYLSVQQTIMLELSDELKQRKHKDIILRWIDAVPKSYLDKYNLFEFARKNAYEFSRTYSETAYTHPVEKAMMTGGKLIDDELNNLNLSHDNELEKYLSSQGYITKIFSKHLKLRDISVMDSVEFEYASEWCPNSMINWFMLLFILESENPVFCIAHTVAETHGPWFTPIMETIDLPNDSMEDNVIEEKRRAGLLYINKKLEIYDSLLSEKAVFIYMSDHGYPNYKSTIANYSENEIHAFCFLYGNGIDAGKNEKFFQHREMKSVISAIVKSDMTLLDDVGDKYATLQGEDVYAKYKIDNVLKRLERTGKVDVSNFMQFRGVLTDTAKYIRYPFMEKYFEEPGDVEIEISQIDAGEMQYLQKLAGNKLIDIKNNEKYQYSRMLYKKLGYKPDN